MKEIMNVRLANGSRMSFIKLVAIAQCAVIIPLFGVLWLIYGHSSEPALTTSTKSVPCSQRDCCLTKTKTNLDYQMYQYQQPQQPQHLLVVPPEPVHDTVRLEKEPKKPKKIKKDKNFIGCEEIAEIRKNSKLLGTGKLRAVYGGEHNSVPIAIKTLCYEENLQMGNNKSRCLSGPGAVFPLQYLSVTLYELALLRMLSHPNIIKLHGYCFDKQFYEYITIEDMLETSLALEIGEDVDEEILENMPWIEKVKFYRSMFDLLVYLNKSPMGALYLDRMPIRQFVMANNRPKLADLEKIRTNRKRCKKAIDCTAKDGIGAKELPHVECRQKLCFNFEDSYNLIAFFDQIQPQLLEKNTPDNVQIKKAMKDFYSAANVTFESSSQFRDRLDNIIDLYAHL